MEGGLLFPRNAQFVHQFIKRGTADSQFFSGLGEVVLMLGKSFQDEGFFNLFLGFLKGLISVAITGGIDFQIGRGDLASFGHNDGAVDMIFQLSDVSCPGMSQQGIYGWLRKSLNLFFEFPGKPLQEGVSQQQDIALPVP